jgi:hypothetical protein
MNKTRVPDPLIHMFLGFPDPDPDPSIIKQKKVRKPLIPTVL